MKLCLLFQSTHPLRGATFQERRLTHNRIISIHAPLAGCDAARLPWGVPSVYFNPRTPCGVRLKFGNVTQIDATFQSTHPLRGATVKRVDDNVDSRFQSTHPLRGATIRNYISVSVCHISIHAPLAGCDDTTYNNIIAFIISIHAPLAGCDKRKCLLHGR